MFASRYRSPAGYSLIQLVVAIGIVTLLMAAAMKAYSIARSGAVAGACAGKLKMLAMELERYRTDHRVYPALLDDLHPGYVKSEQAFQCPEDPRRTATYSDFYAPRCPSDKGKGRLILACPFHQDSGKGVELFLGDAGHERGKTYVAQLQEGGQGVSVLPYDADRPSDAEPTEPRFWTNAVAAVPNMDVGPGDWIRVVTGSATLTFKDGSRAQVTAPTEIMVVDAFDLVGSQTGLEPFYAVLRLARGQVYNIVTPGSKYEIITPTGTAGARGTEYLVSYTPALQGPPPPGKKRKQPKGLTIARVTNGEVYLSGRKGTVLVYPGQTARVDEGGFPRKP